MFYLSLFLLCFQAAAEEAPTEAPRSGRCAKLSRGRGIALHMLNSCLATVGYKGKTRVTGIGGGDIDYLNKVCNEFGYASYEKMGPVARLPTTASCKRSPHSPGCQRRLKVLASLARTYQMYPGCHHGWLNGPCPQKLKANQVHVSFLCSGTLKAVATTPAPPAGGHSHSKA